MRWLSSSAAPRGNTLAWLVAVFMTQESPQTGIANR